MKLIIRRSVKDDLGLLLSLERDSFPEYQQSSKRVLDHSLKSTFQQVWIAEYRFEDGRIETAGSLVLYLYKKTLRIFSILILPEYRGKGAGRELMDHARLIAEEKGVNRITLEADKENIQLIGWYDKAGFKIVKELKDYYDYGRDAVRMECVIRQDRLNERISNIIVVDEPAKWKLSIANAEVISAYDYTSDKGNVSERSLRVFNLCNSYRYQSVGYYVSLLASARDHRAIPSVTTIRDFQDPGNSRLIADDIDHHIQKALRKEKGSEVTLNIYFGQSADDRFKKLSKKLYQIFQAPLFSVSFKRTDKWIISRVKSLSIEKAEDNDLEVIQSLALSYFNSRRFSRTKIRQYRYYLAILTDPGEEHPPSDEKALSLFEKAADEMDLYVEYIRKDDRSRLSEFDALFIRETTRVNSPVYDISRAAYAEGLAVIDDPWSILRCSNKIYLNERLKSNGIPTPSTRVFFRTAFSEADYSLVSFPLILKQPDSAFSLGVTKVNDLNELKGSVELLFKSSDIVIAQEFLPSDFDWRIGVLENQPLYACKYYMARDHWQIYNWKGSEKDRTGNSETIPLFKVPAKILKMAVKAASLMGDGLYGVDLKEIDEKVYVIEVNDNPNIDHGIEDKVEGFDLYRKVIRSLINRIELSRNIARYVSADPETRRH